ncbi:MAG: hypothetical protein ACK53Y_13515, partial [bacterium]
LNESLVRFKLCPSGSCSASCSGGDYVVQAGTFVNAYTEAKMNAFQYTCETLRETCANNCTDLVTAYYSEDTCMSNCYAKSGWSNCTDGYYNLGIVLTILTKAVKSFRGVNSKAFYDTKRFRYRFCFVSGARMYYFKFLILRFKKNFLFEILI